MRIKASLTPDRVSKLKGSITENTSPERAERINSLPDDGVEYFGEKAEFDLPFQELVAWIGENFSKKLIIEHAKFSLSEKIRKALESSEYTQDGKLTKKSAQAVDELVANYRPEPGRTSTLKEKSPEELAKEQAKLERKLAELNAILAQKVS